MNGWERKREILRLAEENGYVKVDYLARRLHISESSIRRDLLSLEAEGEIRRTYGGAEPTKGGARLIPYDLRAHQNEAQKRTVAGLAASLVGLHPGDEFDFGVNEGEPFTSDLDGDGEDETLAVAGVVFGVSRGEKLAKAETDVPADFYDAEIAGRHVVLYYAIDSVDEYTVPEITEELLAEFVPDFTPTEGGDLNGEFRDYVYNLLASHEQQKWHAAIEEQIWAHLDELDCVKKLPGGAIRDEIKRQEKQLESQYEYYGKLLEEKYGVNPYASVEEFGRAYYELDKTDYADVHEYLKEVTAPSVVRQKLIVYYIADREGWKATKEEYETELPKQVAYYAEMEGITAAEAMEKYGEQFFREAIQYNKVLTNLVDVTEIN